MSAPFEERSGVVPCGTPWGQWYQTLEEVFIEVRVPPGTRAQDVRCGLQSRHLSLAVGGRDILKGRLFDATIADEGTWTLGEDGAPGSWSVLRPGWTRNPPLLLLLSLGPGAVSKAPCCGSIRPSLGSRLLFRP